LTQVELEEGARLAHLKCALSGSETHVGTWLADLGKETAYRAFQFTAGTGLARNGVYATFKGEGGRLDISGIFLGRGGEHIDTTLVVDHAVPRCESRELFKGVLADRARGVFQGKVIVRPDAQKSDGKQMAQALLLSQDAEFDSKPELEIHADDVVCGHGSTAAELDEDLLFYLRTRGIPVAEARALLIESFIGEALEKIEDEAVREAFAALAKRRLADIAADAAGQVPEAPRRRT
jgi:Fe-S cluster assembly protein SufD